MLFFVLLLLFVGIVMIRLSVNTKTCFTALMILVAVVSFLMAFNFIHFVLGVIVTILVSLVIIFLDENGILA